MIEGDRWMCADCVLTVCWGGWTFIILISSLRIFSGLFGIWGACRRRVKPVRRHLAEGLAEGVSVRGNLGLGTKAARLLLRLESSSSWKLSSSELKARPLLFYRGELAAQSGDLSTFAAVRLLLLRTLHGFGHEPRTWGDSPRFP